MARTAQWARSRIDVEKESSHYRNIRLSDFQEVSLELY